MHHDPYNAAVQISITKESHSRHWKCDTTVHISFCDESQVASFSSVTTHMWLKSLNSHNCWHMKVTESSRYVENEPLSLHENVDTTTYVKHFNIHTLFKLIYTKLKNYFVEMLLISSLYLLELMNYRILKIDCRFWVTLYHLPIFLFKINYNQKLCYIKEYINIIRLKQETYYSMIFLV